MGDMSSIVDDVVEPFSLSSEITGITLGGSIARGWADEDSDTELYFYSDKNVFPRSAREDILYEAGAEDIEHWYEEGWGEYTFFQYEDVKVDASFRSLESTKNDLDELLSGNIDQRTEDIRYTAFGHYLEGKASDILESQILYENDKEITQLKTKIDCYPEEVQSKIISKHLGGARKLLEKRVKKGAERDDFLLFDAASSRVMRSAIRSLFALNETYFPGDKWNEEYFDEFEVISEEFVNNLDRYKEENKLDQKYDALESMVCELERLKE